MNTVAVREKGENGMERGERRDTRRREDKTKGGDKRSGKEEERGEKRKTVFD